VVAGDAQHLVSLIAQALEELAGFAKLLGPRPLREIAADYEKVRFQVGNFMFDRCYELLVMSAEMQVGQVDETGHASFNSVASNLFQRIGFAEPNR